MMKQVFKCRVCEKSDLPIIDYLIVKQTQVKLPLYHCDNCNSYFTNPPPYNYDEDWDAINYYTNIKDNLIKRYTAVFEHIKYLGIQGKCLDIGCGIGYSLTIANRYGWNSCGIEPNQKIANYSKRVLQLNIVNRHLQKWH